MPGSSKISNNQTCYNIKKQQLKMRKQMLLIYYIITSSSVAVSYKSRVIALLITECQS